MPTFTRSSSKNQGAHRGPAHSKQVLVRELQRGEGLSLQHGVQVDMAIGPSTQEEIPRPWKKKGLHGASAALLGCLPMQHSLGLRKRQALGPTTKLQRITLLVSKSSGAGQPSRLAPLPVKRGTAHRVHRATMRREGELHRGPKRHRAGHPSESGCLCCQGTLEGEATFCAQNEKAGVKAGEGH